MNKPQIETPIYKEWQIAKISSFAPHLLVFPSIWLVFAPINSDFGLWFGIFATALSIALRLALAKRITVTATYLQIGKATIPRVFLGPVEVIEAERHFSEKGSSLDTRAFLALKGLPGLLKITNTDPQDPTPYILVSTRRPRELQRALND
jgi:hypothetical protein